MEDGGIGTGTVMEDGGKYGLLAEAGEGVDPGCAGVGTARVEIGDSGVVNIAGASGLGRLRLERELARPLGDGGTLMLAGIALLVVVVVVALGFALVMTLALTALGDEVVVEAGVALVKVSLLRSGSSRLLRRREVGEAERPRL